MQFLKNAAVRMIVRGRVQGVGFRYFICREAQRLGLRGYAKNMFNGDVEIVAEGRMEFLQELVSKARTGPSGAYVSDTQVEWLDFENKFHNFSIK